MIDKLNSHYSFTNPATVHDEEALTTLELVGRTTAKVNECVEEVNHIPEKIAKDVQTHIEAGEFDKQIDKSMGDFKTTTEKRINNLLGNVANGSITSMDAEVIDARLGVEGNTHSTLGEAIRYQLTRSMKRVNNTSHGFNANNFLDTGYYFVSSGETWSNLPAGEHTGVLVNYAGIGVSRNYQLFISHYDHYYIRHSVNNSFEDRAWVMLGDESTALMLMNGYTGTLPSSSLDDIKTMGMYRVGSSIAHDAPSTAGLLMVYSTGLTTQCYQLFLGYDANMFFRSLQNNVWSNWQRVAVGSGTETGGSVTVEKPYTYQIRKVSNDEFNLYFKGTKGYVCYVIKRVRADEFKSLLHINRILACDNNFNVVKEISEVGVDNEGVIKEATGTDALGGVHGDEVVNNIKMYIGGVRYNMEDVVDMGANNVVIFVESTIHHQDGGAACATRLKRITFDNTGIVEIRNCWKLKEKLSLMHVYGSMLSIKKDCFTQYYDSKVNYNPVNTPANTGTKAISTDSTITDFYFIGDIYAKVWPSLRGGEPANYSTLIQDYGDRVKAYFGCYVGQEVANNFVMKTEGKFYITY